MKRQILVLLLLIWMPIAGLTADQQVVTIDVAGLACPFCVYSLEKSLTRLENIESVEVDLAGAFARIVILAGREAGLDAIRQAIVNAGFTPGDATTSSGG